VGGTNFARAWYGEMGMIEIRSRSLVWERSWLPVPHAFFYEHACLILWIAASSRLR